MQTETRRVPTGSAPEAATAFMNRECERWGKLIRDSGYKLQ